MCRRSVSSLTYDSRSSRGVSGGTTATLGTNLWAIILGGIITPLEGGKTKYIPGGNGSSGSESSLLAQEATSRAPVFTVTSIRVSLGRKSYRMFSSENAATSTAAAVMGHPLVGRPSTSPTADGATRRAWG